MITFQEGFDLPAFFSPGSYTAHPDTDKHERQLNAWLDQDSPYPDPLATAWAKASRWGLFTGLSCPEGDAHRLMPLTMWANFLFALDDANDYDLEGLGIGTTPKRDRLENTPLGGMICQAGHLDDIMARPGPALECSSFYVRKLGEVSASIRDSATPFLARKFVDEHLRWTVGEMWQAATAGTVSSLETYTAQRMRNSASEPYAVLCDHINHINITSEEWHDPTVTAAHQASNLLLSWDNDLISYPKERFVGEDDYNLVTVMAHHHGCSAEDAVPECVALRDRVMSLLLALHEKITRSCSPDMKQHMDGLVQRVHAIDEWSATVCRYTHSDRSQMPPQEVRPVPMEWTDTPSNPSMDAPGIATIDWMWEVLSAA